MHNHEKQLDLLLKLGLTVHPLTKENCWGIFASTKEKEILRFNYIKEVFPHATLIKINPLKGDFGVDLYGELKK